MTIHTILKNFGLSEKEISIYTTLMTLGPSPVRLIAEKSGINRGTSYDILKSLMELGLVSYVNKQSHQYFAVESPEKLLHALDAKQQNIEQVKKDIEAHLPELKLVFDRQGGKPQVKLYEGLKGIKQILEDVINSSSKQREKIYYVFSSASVRKDVYDAMPDFSDKRIAKKIKVRTIAMGQGGQLVGLDERKWLVEHGNAGSATYEIIYAGKVAHVSLDEAGQPIGVIIENEPMYETQRVIFNSLWEKI